MRRGVYTATYIVATVEDAVSLVSQMEQYVLSSFGEGDDQWEGLYFTDPGVVVAIDVGPLKSKVAVHVTCPVECVPKDYWLSPYCAENVETFAQDGVTSTRGEAAAWGMKFKRRK